MNDNKCANLHSLLKNILGVFSNIDFLEKVRF